MCRTTGNGYRCNADDEEREHFWIHTKPCTHDFIKKTLAANIFALSKTGQGTRPEEIQGWHRPVIWALVPQGNFYKTGYRMVDPMTALFPQYRRGTIAICLLALLVLMLTASGCTQPALQQPQQAPAPVTAAQNDDSHITISYHGSTDTASLLELEATVTDSKGKSQTQSVGDHLSTTPLRYTATISFTGSFGGNDHVLVTGYFLDGSQKLMLDTTL